MILRYVETRNGKDQLKSNKNYIFKIKSEDFMQINHRNSIVRNFNWAKWICNCVKQILNCMKIIWSCVN